jgi:hypothetical protein
MTAMMAYRHPGKRVFWDIECSQRVGRMRLDDDGKLYTQTPDGWQEIAPDRVLYDATIDRPKKARRSARGSASSGNRS